MNEEEKYSPFDCIDRKKNMSNKNRPYDRRYSDDACTLSKPALGERMPMEYQTC